MYILIAMQDVHSTDRKPAKMHNTSAQENSVAERSEQLSGN